VARQLYTLKRSDHTFGPEQLRADCVPTLCGCVPVSQNSYRNSLVWLHGNIDFITLVNKIAQHLQNKISIMQICSDVSTHYHFCNMYTLKQYDSVTSV
jgi:hypothetical protein